MAMTCNDYRQGHPALSDAARAHEAQCAECREFARSWDLLREYPPIEARAGFFHGVRRKLSPAILRFAAPLAAAAAALLLVLLLTHPARTSLPSSPAVTEEERELVENLDILKNLDLLQTLELVGDPPPPLNEDKK
jgi:hypothetical protein